MAKKIKDKAKVSKNSKLKQKFPIVRICIKANANNSLVTLTDLQGQIIAWASAGKVGFKGSKKATPFASQKVTEEILDKAKAVEATSVHLMINGGGMGRESFPHGGTKKANRRRI
jgi:small subunit ribosomal protein S11